MQTLKHSLGQQHSCARTWSTLGYLPPEISLYESRPDQRKVAPSFLTASTIILPSATSCAAVRPRWHKTVWRTHPLERHVGPKVAVHTVSSRLTRARASRNARDHEDVGRAFDGLCDLGLVTDAEVDAEGFLESAELLCIGRPCRSRTTPRSLSFCPAGLLASRVRPRMRYDLSLSSSAVTTEPPCSLRKRLVLSTKRAHLLARAACNDDERGGGIRDDSHLARASRKRQRARIRPEGSRRRAMTTKRARAEGSQLTVAGWSGKRRGAVQHGEQGRPVVRVQIKAAAAD
jgi:hypothetical protein